MKEKYVMKIELKIERLIFIKLNDLGKFVAIDSVTK